MIIREEIERAHGMDNLCRSLIERASVSRDTRREDCKRFRTLLHTGSLDGQQRRVNKTHNYIDKLASLLFSPSDVRFDISFDADETAEWSGMADLAARHLNREFKVRKCNLAFGQALEIALAEASCFIKLTWGRRGFTPHIVRQQFMGVGREDLNDFDDQDFFIHTYFVTEWELFRLLRSNSKRDEIMARTAASFSQNTEAVTEASDISPGSYLHEIVIGGNQPVGAGNPTGSAGSVAVFGPPRATLAAEVASRLVQVFDIWVLNDLANDGEGGWGTIRWVEPGIVVEGDKMVRNLGDLPYEHPFLKVSPNEVPGYFWGFSELSWVAYVQEWFANRVGNVDDIFALRARPPRSFEGFSGITVEKMRALLTRGGTFTSDAPAGTTRIATYAPDMPGEAMALLGFIEQAFDEAGGMTGMISGQGQPGVRSGAQANTLLRTSTPRIRDRATAVEAQVTDFGDLCWQMARIKEGRVFHTEDGKDFTLSLLPSDAVVGVDSHTSSPAFSGDNLQLAFALVKAGAIDGEDLLNMVQPPHVDELILKYRARQKAQQTELKSIETNDPELFKKLAEKRISGGRR